MAGPPNSSVFPVPGHISRERGEDDEKSKDGSVYAYSETSTIEPDADWEPSADDVEAELKELMKEDRAKDGDDEDADEAEESDNDDSPGYEVLNGDGTSTLVQIQPRNSAANDDEQKLYDQLKAKSEFRESQIRGALRFRHVIKRAEASAALTEHTFIPVNDNFDKQAKTAFIECNNGNWINSNMRGGRPSLRKLRENELATMSFNNDCVCQLCSKQKEFIDRYNFRVQQERATGTTRSNKPYKAGMGTA